jgi:hypothetical protein
LRSPYRLPDDAVLELRRVALDHHHVAVTRVIAIALRRLEKAAPHVRLVVSFADPGVGHVGGIYQGGGWLYTGTSRVGTVLALDGKVYHCRMAKDVVGTTSTVNLRAAGHAATVERTPPKHRYLMPLDPAMRTQVAELAKPYPERWNC